jgi:leucyl aminopeptidase (aminopeptidase T)
MYTLENETLFYELKECFEENNNVVCGLVISHDCTEEQFPDCKEGNILYEENRTRLGDFVIIIQPLSEQFSKTIFKKLNRIENESLNCIIIDWPSKKTFGNLYNSVVCLYHKALSIDYDRLYSINRKVYKKLKEGKNFFITTDEGTSLRFKRKSQDVYCENCDIRAERIYELPGGEVFFALEKEYTQGKFFYDEKLYEVNQGEIIFQEEMIKGIERYVFCEFGIGTNYMLPFVSAINICEKAKFTCHFGFGNNTAFGGDLNKEYHFDITLSKFSLYIDNKLINIKQFFES